MRAVQAFLLGDSAEHGVSSEHSLESPTVLRRSTSLGTAPHLSGRTCEVL